MIRNVPESGSRFFTHPGSQIQGSKKHRIPDTGSSTLVCKLNNPPHSPSLPQRQPHGSLRSLSWGWNEARQTYTHKKYLSGQECFQNSFSDPDLDWIWIQSGQWIHIRIRFQEGKNFMFWSAGCSLLRAEGFFYSLDVLSGGQGIGKF